MNQTIRVAIAGLGTIGSGVATVIQDHRAKGAAVQLVKILEIDKKGPHARKFYSEQPDLFVEDLQKIVKDPHIDVIVETIGGRGFAKIVIEEALNHGKHVISANKDLIATDGHELLKLARQVQKYFLFEASVGGAVPVIHLMQNYFSLPDIQEISGIINGTTNYILSEMDQRGVSFEVALKEAQEKGFAEQDPTNDIKGYDARYKIVILIYLITGKWIPVEEVAVEGIDTLESPDFEYAARMNRKIKLVAYFCCKENQLRVFVTPLMIPQERTLAKITGSTNIITVTGRYSEEISLIGKGAGARPTASAIVSDIHKIRNATSPAAPSWLIQPDYILPFSECVFKHTLRFDINDQPGIVGNIGNLLANYGINIYALEQLPQYHHRERGREKTIFHLTLEACQEGIVQKAAAEINAASYMARPVFILRELQH